MKNKYNTRVCVCTCFCAHVFVYLLISENEIQSLSCYWYVDAMCSVLTPSLEEKAHAEGRISLCQHIRNPFVCVCVCPCVCLLVPNPPLQSDSPLSGVKKGGGWLVGLVGGWCFFLR